jgi:arylsulfatase A-like enzyme
LYGYERDTSPFLDRFFGEGGTVFDHLVSAATTTGPSHMSIMTSLPPSQHGARRGLQALSARVPTLAEQLRAEGFATAAFTENGSLDRRRGFGLGFDEYFESKSSDIRSPVGDIERTLDRARSWLSRNRGARSFLFLHTYQVHAPYKPPPSYRDLFEGDGEGQRAKDPARRAPIDDYDREIRYTDDVLAKFFAWLEDAELLGRSLIVVTADHGEEFLDHGRIGHRSLPHQELVHVPFLMRGPGVPAGRRVTGLASHVDLAPTLLELLGAPSLDHARGRSLLSSMADRSPAEDALRPVFSETWALDPPYIPPSVSVQLGDHKLIRFRTAAGPAVRLYDLVEDPGEERDIAALEPLRVATLKELLDEYVALERQGGKEVEIDAALEQKLRVLGYIE